MRPTPDPGPAFRVEWVAGLPVLRAERLLGAGFAHAFTTRHYPQDPPGDSQALRALGFDPQRVVEAEQVHGAAVAAADGKRPGRVAGADGLWTAQPGVVLRVRCADCLAVLLADPATGCVAAVHAGWRGLAGGVLARAVRALREAGCRPSDLLCAAGPSVGPCCYEVDAPVRAALQTYPEAFRPGRPGHWQLDLREVAREQLVAEGVLPGHVDVCGLCTACRPDWFYSYRREGTAGRLWGVVCARG